MRARPAAALLLCFAAAAPATQGAQRPDDLVRETTDRVLAEISVNRSAMRADANLLYAMVDRIVLPHFDFERMSRLVLGKHWKSVTAAQRAQFIEEFRALLVRTYATALLEYSGQEIVYKPLHAKEGAERVLVKTEVVPSDGPRVPLDYALARSEDDAWRVYDVRIEGISMVTNYRTSYGEIIQSQGMDSLIASLHQKREAAGD